MDTVLGVLNVPLVVVVLLDAPISGTVLNVRHWLLTMVLVAPESQRTVRDRSKCFPCIDLAVINMIGIRSFPYL